MGLQEELTLKVVLDTNLLIDYIEDKNNQNAINIFEEITKYASNNYIAFSTHSLAILEALDVRKKELYMMHVITQLNLSAKTACTTKERFGKIDNVVMAKIGADAYSELENKLNLCGLEINDGNTSLDVLLEEAKSVLQNTKLSYQDTLIACYAILLGANVILTGDTQFVDESKKLEEIISNVDGLIGRPLVKQSADFSTAEALYNEYYELYIKPKYMFAEVDNVYENSDVIQLKNIKGGFDINKIKNENIFLYKQSGIQILNGVVENIEVDKDNIVTLKMKQMNIKLSNNNSRNADVLIDL